MTKKKVLKVMGIVLMIAIALLLIHTVRNTIIICKLQNKVEEYANSNNYHVKMVSNMGTGTTMIINHYQKDNRQVMVLERIDNQRRKCKNINV